MALAVTSTRCHLDSGIVKRNNVQHACVVHSRSLHKGYCGTRHRPKLPEDSPLAAAVTIIKLTASAASATFRRGHELTICQSDISPTTSCRSTAASLFSRAEGYSSAGPNLFSRAVIVQLRLTAKPERKQAKT